MLKSFSVSTCSRGAPSSVRPSIQAGTSRPAAREDGRREIDGADRVGHDRARRDTGSTQEQRHAQQRVVAERTLEDHLVLAEELTVVGGHDHERVVGQPARRKLVEHAADRMIELRDHAVVARRQPGELFTRVVGAARIRPFECGLAHTVRERFVKRRLGRELVGVDLGEDLEHVFGRIAITPGRGRVHRMVRVREAHPPEERAVDRREPLARAVGDPAWCSAPLRGARCATSACGPTAHPPLPAASTAAFRTPRS